VGKHLSLLRQEETLFQQPKPCSSYKQAAPKNGSKLIQGIHGRGKQEAIG
jgi:hypothetical protein